MAADDQRSDLDDDVRALYQSRVMEHARQPRNFGKVLDATHHATGYNRLCGDEVTLTLRCEGERVAAVGFEGVGCALSIASASLLTTAVSGLLRAEADAVRERVMAMLEGRGDVAPEALGDVVVLASVRAFPARLRCVTLAWQTLADALST